MASIQRTDWLHAAAVLTELSGPRAFVLNAGFDEAITRNGPGDYTLILIESLASAEAQCAAWAGPNELLVCGAMVTDPGIVRVLCYSTTGVPTDPVSLNVEIKQLQTGPQGEGTLPPVPPPLPPPSGGSDFVIWRPAVPSSGNVYQTWAEIEPLIAAAQGFLLVYVDSPGTPAQIPATANTACFGRLRFAGYPPHLTTGQTVIEVLDGGQLRDVSEFSGCYLFGAPSVQPPLVQTINGTELIFREGSGATLGAGAAAPLIRLSGNGQEVAFALGSTPSNDSGNPALSLIDCPTPGGFSIVGIVSHYGNGGPPQAPANFVQGPAGATLVWLYDPTGTPVAQPNFLGTLVPLPADWAAGVAYDDALQAPALGSSNVQGALDALKVITAALGTPIAALRWVSTSGSDVTGNGSIVNPLATVTAAYASITDASPTKRYGIMVADRLPIEPAPVAIKANVYVVGTSGPFASRVQAPSWSLDASFSPAGDHRAGFLNCTVAGNITADFLTLASNEGKFAFFNAWVNSAFVMRAFSLIQQLIVENTRTFAAWDVQGVYSGRNNYWGAPFTISEELTAGTRFELESDNDHFEAGLVLDCNNSTANAAELRAGTCANLATTRQVAGVGTIAIEATADFLSGVVTLGAGGFTTLTKLTAAKGIAFTPAAGITATDTQAAIEQAATLPVAVYIYDPAAVPAGNVYADLLLLLAAAQLVRGPKLINITNPPNGMPTGTYDFLDCELVTDIRNTSGGYLGLTYSRLNFLAGSRIANMPTRLRNVGFWLDGQSAGPDVGPFCTFAAGTYATILEGLSDLVYQPPVAGPAAVCFDVTGCQVEFAIRDSSMVQCAAGVGAMFSGAGLVYVDLACPGSQAAPGGLIGGSNMLGAGAALTVAGIGPLSPLSGMTGGGAKRYLHGGGTGSNDARYGVETTPAIAANQLSFAPVGLAYADTLRVSSSVVGPVQIQGIFADGDTQAGVNCQTRKVINVGANAMQVNNNDAAATAIERILTNTGANLLVPAGGWFFLWYDTTSTRWRAHL